MLERHGQGNKTDIDRSWSSFNARNAIQGFVLQSLRQLIEV